MNKCNVCRVMFGRAASLGAHRWRAHGIKGKNRRPVKAKPGKEMKPKAIRGAGKKRTAIFEPTFACQECGIKLLKGGMGSHLRFKHGIAGTSKWSIKAKKAQKVSKPDVMTTSAADTTVNTFRVIKDVKRMVGVSTDAIRSILEKAAAFRATASEAQNKAERLFKMAAELKELI